MPQFQEVDKATWDYFCGKYGQPKYKTSLATNTYIDEYYELDVDGRKVSMKIRNYISSKNKLYFMWS